MKHKHAENMMLYAQDALTTDRPWEMWEFRFKGDEWKDLIDHAIWRKDCEYRRKPKTININGHEVPEPVRSPLEKDTIYYVPILHWVDKCDESRWGAHKLDLVFLKRGLIHLSEEAASKHAEALLSFTRIEK